MTTESDITGTIDVLEWDSDFFGMAIGRVVLDGADEERLAVIEAEAQALELDCLYGILHDPNTATAVDAQRWGHRLVEVARLYDRPPEPVEYRSVEASVRPATSVDVAAASDALWEVASWSRYGADPRFGLDAAHRMHVAWLERAVRDDDRMAAVAVDANDAITGVTTGSHPDELHRCDFIGITNRGSGDAGALLQAVVDWADGGVIEGGPIAARNIGVNRWMTRCGYIVKRVEYVYHRWLDEPITV